MSYSNKMDTIEDEYFSKVDTGMRMTYFCIAYFGLNCQPFFVKGRGDRHTLS